MRFKFNPRTLRMEKDEMNISPGTERALQRLSEDLPKFNRNIEALTKELKRYNDEREQSKVTYTAEGLPIPVELVGRKDPT